MNKSLIIDGQIFQTDAWYRGMGKYILQVLDELNRKYTHNTEIAILLNKNLPCDKSRFETLKYLFPDLKIVHCDLPIPDKTRNKGSELYKKQLGSCVDKLFPDTEKSYLLTSLFLFDFFAEFPENCHKLAIFYDLTPLLFWSDLGGYFPEELYMRRFRMLYEAEHIFAISETTRQDLLRVFGLLPELVTNINGGFTKIADKTVRPRNFKVPGKYILFPTGDLPHKNNLLTVKAFNQYCLKHKDSVKLLITSRFSDQNKRQLQSLCKHVVFTENVPDDELEWLYENAEAIIFSSKYEGLGMPILDAIANKKPVITSKIPVFEEMTKHAFYYFDPENSDELELQIEQALSKTNFPDKLKHYQEIMDRYTWAKTTKGIQDYVLNDSSESTNSIKKIKSNSELPRVAVCSLHPGIGRQIGQLSEQLYFSLKDKFQVDYYFDGNGLNFRELDRPTFLSQMECRVMDITQLDIRVYSKYIAVIYIIDKFTIPSRIAQRAVVLPGITIAGSFAGLDKQGNLFKQLVLDNSVKIFMYNSEGYNVKQDICKWILSYVNQRDVGHNHLISIRNRRSIMKQLRNMYENNK